MNTTPQKTTIRITGMHCASCDILVKTQLATLTHISEVVPDQSAGTVTITHTLPLSLNDVNTVLCEYGYKVYALDDAHALSDQPSWGSRLKQAGAYALVVGVVWYIFNGLGLMPLVSTSASLTFGSAFIIGLIASVSTCMATTGALFTSYLHYLPNTAAKKTPQLTALFLIGRVASYAIVGFVIGTFGGVLATITQLEGVLTLFIAVTLIIMGLDMVRLLSLSAILRHIPFVKHVSSSLENSASHHHGRVWGPLALGFMTYFLPCGFSLSIQAYAVALANPLQSAGLMAAFALGTVPALLALSFTSKIRHSPFYRHVIHIFGVITVFVGLSYVANMLVLFNLVPSTWISDVTTKAEQTTASPIVNGVQVVRMTATSSGYSPREFVVKQNIPVRWEIDGKEIFGCQGALQSPKAGVKLMYLKPGENIVEFTPTEKGIIQFSCSMGMFSGQFTVI